MRARTLPPLQCSMTTTPFSGTAPLIIRRFGWFSVANSFTSLAIAAETFFGTPVAAPPGNIEFTATVSPASRPTLVVPVLARDVFGASCPGAAIFNSSAIRIGRTFVLRGKLCSLMCALSAETSIFISRTSAFQSGTMVSARFLQPQSSSLRRSQGLKNNAHTARNERGAARIALAIVLAMNRTFVTPTGSSFFFEPGAGPSGPTGAVPFVEFVVVGDGGDDGGDGSDDGGGGADSSITSGSANTYAAPAMPSTVSVPTTRPSRCNASDAPKKPEPVSSPEGTKRTASFQTAETVPSALSLYDL